MLKQDTSLYVGERSAGAIVVVTLSRVRLKKNTHVIVTINSFAKTSELGFFLTNFAVQLQFILRC